MLSLHLPAYGRRLLEAVRRQCASLNRRISLKRAMQYSRYRMLMMSHMITPRCLIWDDWSTGSFRGVFTRREKWLHGPALLFRPQPATKRLHGIESVSRGGQSHNVRRGIAERLDARDGQIELAIPSRPSACLHGCRLKQRPDNTYRMARARFLTPALNRAEHQHKGKRYAISDSIVPSSTSRCRSFAKRR
jgi:hypothetical protein